MSEPHLGHIVAFGAKSAFLLSQEGIRHTAMSKEHILWSTKDHGFRLVGWGNAREIAWPEDAHLHRDDIRVFLEEFGPHLTSCLRLGYSYQLGPIAEWLFYNLEQLSVISYKDLPPFIQTQWEQPQKDWVLGESSELSQDKIKKAMKMGIASRQQKDRSSAQRLFLRCYINGLIAENPQLQLASMANLAIIHGDNEHWLHAFSQYLMALIVSDQVENRPDDFLQSLAVNISRRISKQDHDAMLQIVTQGSWTSIPELLWHLEDYVTVSTVAGVT